MEIPERPELHRTIALNLKRRYVHYVQNPGHLQNAGGEMFLDLLRRDYPKAHDRLVAAVGKDVLSNSQTGNPYAS